ncbi:MAG: hypothetical protein WB609_03175 [Candidatus Cybelea sp.]
MKPSHVFTLSIATAILAACGSLQPPLKTFGSTAPSVAEAGHGRNLLYASTFGDEPLFVYAFPGGKLLGIVTGPIGPRGLCVNKSSDVFAPFIYIPGGVDEFAHGGGTPIAYLGFPYDRPNGCSVDPTTGDLAVVAATLRAVLVVYHYKPKLGWRLATSYSIASMSKAAFCGFDSHGNLFVDGATSGGKFALAELARGHKTFETVSVDQNIAAPGQVQWDGRHLAIGDLGVSPSVIYQFDVSGSNARKAGSTTLAGSTTVEQFWIQKGVVVAPDSGASCGGSQPGCLYLYRYPSGGSPTKTIALPGAFGATVSLRP